MPSTGTRTDPLLAMQFRVTIDGLGVCGFSECSGLDAVLDTQEYREGGQNTFVHRFPSRMTHNALTFRGGIVDRAVWDWFDGTLRGSFERRSGSVAVLDPTGTTVAAQWQFKGAFPTKWRGPDLNAAQSQVALQSFELMHEGLTLKGL